MANDLTSNKILQAINWAYDQAVNGVAGLDSAEDMAHDYLKANGTRLEQVNSLIRWQNSKAAASGFINGLGGVVLMPLTIPANLASVLYVQVRMIAAIAYMGGNAANEVAKEIGIKVGTKMTEQAIKNISSQLLVKINQTVGFRLVTKFGQTGAINLIKIVPVMGGVVGATFDSLCTNAIGNIARNTFISR